MYILGAPITLKAGRQRRRNRSANQARIWYVQLLEFVHCRFAGQTKDSTARTRRLLVLSRLRSLCMLEKKFVILVRIAFFFSLRHVFLQCSSESPTLVACWFLQQRQLFLLQRVSSGSPCSLIGLWSSRTGPNQA